jgi:pilus assembly protein Flp/PilA
MTEMILALANYFKLPVMDEKGQGMVEYALIIVLVAIAVIGTLTILGTTISGVFTTITGNL